MGFIQMFHKRSEGEIKVAVQRGRAGCCFSVDCAFGSVKDKGSGGQTGTDIFFALPNDTNTISWLTEQIESHSLFVSLTLCPCLSVFSFPHTLHHSPLADTVPCTFICYRTLMCYTYPSECCLIAFGSAVCRC